METIRTNLRIGASSQYTNFNFDSMCRFNDVLLGAGDDGFFQLETGTLDNTTKISAYFIPHVSDWGIERPKRLRYVYLGIECAGSVNIYTTYDEGTISGAKKVTMDTSKGQQRIKATMPRTTPFGYGSVKISNVSGVFFAVDSIEIFPVVMHNRRV